MIRPAMLDDLAALTEIYNHYVVSTPITFDVEPFAPAERRAWYDAHTTGPGHRLLVATDASGRVVGYAGAGPFRPKRAYDTTVETTIYLRPESTGAGLGRSLYAALFAALGEDDVHRAVAGITQPNTASMALHRRVGFTEVGVFRENGRKLGRYWDVLWMEKAL